MLPRTEGAPHLSGSAGRLVGASLRVSCFSEASLPVLLLGCPSSAFRGQDSRCIHGRGHSVLVSRLLARPAVGLDVLAVASAPSPPPWTPLCASPVPVEGCSVCLLEARLLCHGLWLSSPQGTGPSGAEGGPQGRVQFGDQGTQQQSPQRPLSPGAGVCLSRPRGFLSCFPFA